MISQTELRLIDEDYFEIINSREYTVTIHSKNTGHDWHLLERFANGHRSFLISHRHNAYEPYHPQKSRPTIEACCDYIKDHDSYHLKRERKKKKGI